MEHLERASRAIARCEVLASEAGAALDRAQLAFPRAVGSPNQVFAMLAWHSQLSPHL
jgi:hypothetical protein